jgi:hypothetical protein
MGAGGAKFLEILDAASVYEYFPEIYVAGSAIIR